LFAVLAFFQTLWKSSGVGVMMYVMIRLLPQYSCISSPHQCSSQISSSAPPDL
jgi:hypothetical protein